jgi:thiamine-phosphate diphosphorylase
MALRLPPLYGILDPEQTHGRAVEIVLREMVEAGVTILQLRVKSLAPVDFLKLAKLARAETQARNCALIVNDRIDIAMACNADGVHLGQEDLPLSAGRKLVGQKIIGISTHDLQQAEEAERHGADYIGFGPMFGTMTKATGYAARGVEMLKQIRAAVRLPIVAIGGITEENVQQVWRAGADSAAIISDILHADDISSKVTRILRQQQANQQQ